MSDNQTEDSKEITKGNKKNFTYNEIQELIKKMNLNYSNKEMKEIVQEVGINERQIIHIDELLEKSRTRRSFSKYSEFYEGLLNLFVTPSERILKILQEVREKLMAYKEERLGKDLDWVIKKIHNEDIYNLNMDLINDLHASSTHNSKGSEMESVIKFFAEYSSDAFTKSKKEDLKTVKDLSNKRREHSSSKNSAIYRVPCLKTSSNMANFNQNFSQTSGNQNSLFFPSSSPNTNRIEAIKYDNNFLISPYSNNSNYSSENIINLKLSSQPKENLFEIINEENESMANKRENYQSLPNKVIYNFMSEPMKSNNLVIENNSDDDNAISNENNIVSNKDQNQINEDKELQNDYNNIVSPREKSSKRSSLKINNTVSSQENNKVSGNDDSPHTNSSEEEELKDNIVNVPSADKRSSANNTNLNLLNKMHNFKRTSKLGRVSLNLFNKKESFLENWNTIDDVEFNIFEYCQAFGRENIMVNISDFIFDKYGLYTIINSKRFETFLDKIRVGYDYLLPYHNDLHAADVLQTSHVFTQYGDLRQILDLTSLDLAAFFIANIIHDFKHPGLNNNYQINKKTSIATKYNDISVLENFHVSSAFKVISHPNSNIFCDLSIEEYRVARKRIVECVLSTDMAKHTKTLTSLKIKFEGDKSLNDFISIANQETKFDRQQEILNFLIHMADISNPGKKFEISRTWTYMVMEEFFLQGDLEKKEKLPVSFLCDRETTNIPKSQVMFISNIVLPSFKLLSSLVPYCNIFVQNMYKNIENWNKEEEENEKKNESK